MSSSSASILGIDLGGTKTALTLFDAATIVPRTSQSFPTEASEGLAAVQDRLLKAVKLICAPDTVAIGLGVPGFINPKTKHVISMPNIPGSDNVDIRQWLTSAIGLPVTIENDARCFTYAEALLGAGKGHPIVLGVTLGTGVGGGIAIDGTLFHGGHGHAGEVGHALLMPGQPPYPTEDRRGDVEQFLSGTAMGKRCEAARRPQDYLEGHVCSFLQPEVIREVAWFIVNAMHFIDPSIVVFGGSTGRALNTHLSTIEKEVSAWLLPGVKPPELACGVLVDAAVRGAALLAAADTVPPTKFP
ncbi:ROK family protein [Candidatus Peregrinibacteria bacterium]|nr:ROK family protein [Candidatus Peregrinibacteria bacterium]